jgi:hypothetical protein
MNIAKVKILAVLVALSIQPCLQLSLKAQEQSPRVEAPSAIEDNSFLIEEAFNQEDRVVQHISNATYVTAPTRDLTYTFTQEWPVGSQTHQFSYTVPYMFLNSNTINGFGDVMINYRYQAMTKEQWMSMAPRLSIIIPTGSEDRGTGMGAAGLQVNITASKYISEQFIAHFNFGTTLYPNAKAQASNGSEVQKTLQWFNAGGSIIWLARPEFNILFECGENFTSGIDGNGEIEHANSTFLSPGMRYAVNLDKLQIVPGIGVPVIISEGTSQAGLFFYLSFEHPL